MKTPQWMKQAKYRGDYWRRYVAAFGLLGAVRAYRMTRLGPEAIGGVTSIAPPGLEHPVFLRRATSDIVVFEKIFVWNEYAIPIDGAVENIVDLGANIGLSAVYFASRFPHARVVAVEPDAANYQLLCRNTAPYRNVVPLHAAVWDRCCRLVPENPEAASDSFRFAECPATTPGSVRAFDLSTIRNTHRMTTLDVVKMDIEGGEHAVLARNGHGWLEVTRMLLIEFHSPSLRRAALDVLAGVRWRHFASGENDCFVRIG